MHRLIFRPWSYNVLRFLAAFLVLPPSIQAGPPSVFAFFRASSSAEQVSDADLELKAEHGPWLILAATLTGTESQQKAQELAREIRQKYRLTAYVLPKQFDYSQSVLGNGLELDGKQKRMRYIDDQKIDVYGVLIGDFDSMDNPNIRETLQKIKKLEPATLATKKDSKSDSQPNSTEKGWQQLNSGSQQNGTEKPLSRAFVTRNPLLPEDYFQSPKVDKFVKSLNQHADYSLLESKGRFTVCVATFRGNDSVVLKSSHAAQLASESPAGEALEQAAFHANLAAGVLRRAGYDAYEFHDRNMSIVTVGSFDSLGSENAKNQFVYSSEIRQVIQEFGGAKEYRISQLGPVPVAKTLLDVVNYRKIPELLHGSESEKLVKVKQYSVPFNIDPRAMAIPRPETNKLYSSSWLGRN
ncbi:MAG: hypothetical protein SGI77_03250 [Pirellulaceae bacterium]|nr:hypothetical protein [Pirellulaceae bacterium]